MQISFQVFDGIVVIASFTLDLCYINGLTNYPVESFVLILVIMIPWRIIRVLNSKNYLGLFLSFPLYILSRISFVSVQCSVEAHSIYTVNVLCIGWLILVIFARRVVVARQCMPSPCRSFTSALTCLVLSRCCIIDQLITR